MAYDAKITRQDPGYFIFLVDHSGSMHDQQGGSSNVSKAENVADAINRLLNNLVIRSSRGNSVRDYFSVSIVAYGNDQVWAPWQGGLAGSTIVTTSQLEANPARVEARVDRVPDGAGGYRNLSINVPVYVDSAAGGSTPMCKALENAYRLCEWWVERHPAGFPPIVLNLTDGEATDGDPVAGARRLTSLATSNGNVLLFNLHVSSGIGPMQLYPLSDATLAGDFAKRLFGMSSILPQSMLQAAAGLGLTLEPGSRGFVFNADPLQLVQFLQIGTTPNVYATSPDR
jgi:hypothetical protein